jgi:hypothetical protein
MTRNVHLGIAKIPTFSKTVIPKCPIPNTGKYRYLNKKIKAIKRQIFQPILMCNSLLERKIIFKIANRKRYQLHDENIQDF